MVEKGQKWWWRQNSQRKTDWTYLNILYFTIYFTDGWYFVEATRTDFLRRSSVNSECLWVTLRVTILSCTTGLDPNFRHPNLPWFERLGHTNWLRLRPLFFFAERFPDFISPIFSPNLFFEHCRVGGGDRVQSKVQTMWQSLGWDGMSPWGIRQWLFYREKMMIQWSWATRLSDKPTNTTIYAGYFDAETENRYQCDINRYV